MARVVTLGSALQDIYLIDHDDLVPTNIGDAAIFGKVLVGSKVDIDRLQYGVGGGGINAAITLARHGHEVVFMGNVAHDAAGEAIVRTLNREGIDSSYVSFNSGKTTGTSVILLDSVHGERTILTYRGSSEKFYNFSVQDLELAQPDWLYVTTLRGDLDTLTRFFEKAHGLGVKIMFNPGVKELEMPEEILKLLKYVDVLLLNKSEAAKLVNGAMLNELLYRLNNYTRIAIITDGAMGGIAGDKDTGEIYRFGIYEDVRIKDATGAGDAFGSGFLAHLASGHNFKDALIFASANSTSVVSRIGANEGALTGRERLHPMPIQKL